MTLRDEVRLRHVHEACAKIGEFVAGISREEFDADEIRALAVIRLIEVVGEAAHRVSTELKARRPEIPWRQLAGARNRLIHGYFDVDLAVVWEIATKDVPRLREQVRDVLETLRDGDE